MTSCATDAMTKTSVTELVLWFATRSIASRSLRAAMFVTMVEVPRRTLDLGQRAVVRPEVPSPAALAEAPALLLVWRHPEPAEAVPAVALDDGGADVVVREQPAVLAGVDDAAIRCRLSLHSRTVGGRSPLVKVA